MNFLFQSFQALLKFLLDETESHLIKHKNSYIISMKKMVQRPIFLFAHICLNTHTLLDDWSEFESSKGWGQERERESPRS